ncbi:carbohydrate kinase family protein [Mesohalobacter halotolerans]|uniref:Carbohydrate kinase family protein n=1 Tax=Mesohalobacter halotolerans TaxID=1883405 RepID=A0A4U5TNV6_9FLAO|nr:PfkB family carbohydrate kinase [Mesohalobacter halotolerans]MBS3738333.1 carbohydrate kinase family protein [Psychroflexus sp.]TKS55606.1 carbohydrate kinase family protein [Mesohalobacter halotolerans]
MKKIAVVGPIPRDTISTHHDEVIKKYGCITHPCIALAKLMKNDGEVYPISHIHKADEEDIKSLFSDYKAIKTQGVSSSNNAGTVIFLDFVDQNNRREKQTAFMSPILPEDVQPFLNVDAFVFVPISDFEIPLQTLQFIKANSKAKIIFDAHGPTTSVTTQGDRLRRFWIEIKQWLPYIDILKMNLEESQCCWFKSEYDLNEMQAYDDQHKEHLDDLAKFVLQHKTSHLYITLDTEGCVHYTLSQDKTIEKTFIKSMKMEDVIDTTGCGDSFAGGLAYGFAYHSNPVIAGQYANILGALRTQGKTFDVFKSKEDTNKILESYYN